MVEASVGQTSKLASVLNTLPISSSQANSTILGPAGVKRHASSVAVHPPPSLVFLPGGTKASVPASF